MNELLEGIDPEALAILKEVSEQPDSKLFRYSAKQIEAGPRDSDPRITSSEPGLSSAEKELVKVFRREVSRAIVRVARAAFHSSAFGQRWYSELYPSNQVRPLGVDISSYAREVPYGQRLKDSQGTDLLRTLLSLPNSGLTSDSVRGLLSASLRLNPTPGTRFHIAVSYAASGKLKTCRNLLVEGIRNGDLQPYLAMALTSLGVTAIASGDRPTAHTAYLLALDENPDSASGLVSLAGCALCLGDTSTAKRALDNLRRIELSPQARACLIRQQARVWERTPTGNGADYISAVQFMEANKTIKDALLN